MSFSSHGHLQHARSKVGANNWSFGKNHYGGKAVVFLDCAKSRGELRPALLTHKAFDIICDMESSRDDKIDAEKDMRGKTVKLASKRCGYSLHGTWQWTPYAVQRYGAEIDMMTAYVNGF